MANPRILYKNSQFRAVSTAPSINKTPMGNSTPPVPYPVTHDLSNSQGVVAKFKLNGDPVYVFGQSTQPKCIGDNPGTAGGIHSGTVNGEIKPTSSSGHQKVMGKKVMRVSDKCTMNKGNCPGVYVSEAPPATGKAATSPPIKPESPEEKGFMGKAADLYKKLDIKALRNIKDGINKGIDGMVESSGYNPVIMAIGAVALAANEVIVPENITDFTPAKLFKAGAKGVKAVKGVNKAEHAATAVVKAEGNTAKAAAKTGGSGKGHSHKGKGEKPRKPRQPDPKEWKENGGKIKKNDDGSTIYINKDGKSVTYNKDGYPDFTPHSKANVEIEGMKGDGTDFTKATKEYQKENPGWKKPNDMTWHHHEDGKTMQLVDRGVHKEFSHTGGASITRNAVN